MSRSGNIRLRDLKPDRRRERRLTMTRSARAKVPNTNEWRLAQAMKAHDARHLTPRRARANPLWKLGMFLDAVAGYVDPNGSPGREPKNDLAYSRAHLAFPAVPQDHLEALIPYLERRSGLLL